MIRNYLNTIFRQIKKNRLFSFINIFGLALGMSACLVIAQYVAFHSSFDNFHKRADSLYRVEAAITKGDQNLGSTARVPSLLGANLLEKIPSISKVARAWPFNYANSTLILEKENGKEFFEQKSVYMVDRSSFEMFDLPFIAGSAVNFDEKAKAILSQESAKKMFNDPQQAIGKTFILSGNTGVQTYEIVGVLAEIPKNSHFSFELLLSYESMDFYSDARENWDYFSAVFTYILVDQNLDDSIFREETNAIISQNTPNSQNTYRFSLQNIQDIHLHSSVGYEMEAGIDAKIVAALSVIAGIILLIAWINYMNLSLVRTIERIKEMGVRLCLGSSKRQITKLFVLEALVMNLLAFLLAIVMIQIGEKYIQSITGLAYDALVNIQVIVFLFLLIGLGTAIIGFYPLILLKTMRAVNVLTGYNGKLAGGRIRKGLVFVQFMITTFLIAGTYSVYRQIDYMKNADLKIETENIIVLKSPPGSISDEDREDVKKFQKFSTALAKYPQVAAITSGGECPGEVVSWGARIRLKNQEVDKGINTSLISMDVSYPDFFGIDVLAGRALRPGDSPWTKGDVVINDRLAKQLGFSSPSEAIGAELSGFYAPLTIRGVLENHHHTSLHSDYQPTAFIISGWSEYYFIKIQDEGSRVHPKQELDRTLALIEAEWKSSFQNYPFDFFFLDTHFNEQYASDEKFGNLFSGFSVLAIFIACLGLFGLTAFTVQQRTKEIGIRKVLGATIDNLLFLLSREYLFLVVIAALLALPLAYFAVSEFLLSYTFRIEIGFWFMLLPVFLVLSLALLSVFSRILTTARKNPVDSIRYE